jgi:hypothetical protein
MFLAGPALAVKLMGWAVRRAGMERVAAWLAGRRLLLETEVAREIEWLVATELLEIPCRRRDRTSYRDAIAETILADERAAALLVASAGADPDFRRRLALRSRAISGRAPRRQRSQPALSPPAWVPWSSSRRHRGWLP